jgi:hypothetical protein
VELWYATLTPFTVAVTFALEPDVVTVTQIVRPVLFVLGAPKDRPAPAKLLL